MLLASVLLLAASWRTLAPGMELREGPIVVLRMDPARWELALVGGASRTARDWARGHGLAAAINAGMYATDGATHVGYMECGGKISSKKINAYRSVAAFSPKRGSDPPFRIIDLQGRADLDRLRSRYACLVQNLRLVQRPGVSRWGPQPKKWSEAALGEDRQGRILFMIAPDGYFTLHELSVYLTGSDLNLDIALNLDGGGSTGILVANPREIISPNTLLPFVILVYPR